MNVHPSIWDQLNRVVLVLLLIAGGMCVFFWYLPLIQQNRRMRAELLSLQRQVAAEAAIARHLRASIDAELHDTRTLVRGARESLSYARPNETLFRFE